MTPTVTESEWKKHTNRIAYGSRINIYCGMRRRNVYLSVSPVFIWRNGVNRWVVECAGWINGNSTQINALTADWNSFSLIWRFLNIFLILDSFFYIFGIFVEFLWFFFRIFLIFSEFFRFLPNFFRIFSNFFDFRWKKIFFVYLLDHCDPFHCWWVLLFRMKLLVWWGLRMWMVCLDEHADVAVVVDQLYLFLFKKQRETHMAD